jgi:hypothetical protein
METYSRNKTRRASSSVCSQQKRPIQRNTGQNKTKKQQKTHLLSSTAGKCLLLKHNNFLFSTRFQASFVSESKTEKQASTQDMRRILARNLYPRKTHNSKPGFHKCCETEKKTEKIYIRAKHCLLLLL